MMMMMLIENSKKNKIKIEKSKIKKFPYFSFILPFVKSLFLIIFINYRHHLQKILIFKEEENEKFSIGFFLSYQINN